MTGQIVTIKDNSYVTEVIGNMNTPKFLHLLFLLDFLHIASTWNYVASIVWWWVNSELQRIWKVGWWPALFWEGMKKTTDSPSHDS
jgi:hypothetical protein